MLVLIKETVFLILQILNFFKIYLTDTVGGGSMLDFEVLRHILL